MFFPPDSETGEIMLNVASYLIYISIMSDLLSVLLSILSVVIFYRTQSRSPFNAMLLVLNSIHVLIISFDLADYFCRVAAGGHAIYWTLYEHPIWSHLLYPLMYILYLIQIWFVVVMVLERWMKYRKPDDPWSSVTVFRACSIAFIACLSISMFTFFERSLTRNDMQASHYYTVIYTYLVLLFFYFLIPYSMIIGFSLVTYFRFVHNKPTSSLSAEALADRARTKTAFLVAICFVLSNNLGFIVFIAHSSGLWQPDHWELFILIFELQTLLSSVNLVTVFGLYVGFLEDFRGCLLEMVREVIRGMVAIFRRLRGGEGGRGEGDGEEARGSGPSYGRLENGSDREEDMENMASAI